MNYIKEVNSFYDWLETNSVSDSAINLWHALMSINNKASNNAEWTIEFTVAISTLMVKTSLSKSSIIRARNQLKQLGRIDFRERKGNQSSVYTIFAFQTDTQSATQSATQTDTQCGTQSDTINKLNETKQNKKNNKKEFDLSFVDDGYKKIFNDWIEYKKGKGQTYKTQKSLEMCYKKLMKDSNSNQQLAIEIIEFAIANNYSGFFELKQKGGTNGRYDETESYADMQRKKELQERRHAALQTT